MRYIKHGKIKDSRGKVYFIRDFYKLPEIDYNNLSMGDILNPNCIQLEVVSYEDVTPLYHDGKERVFAEVSYTFPCRKITYKVINNKIEIRGVEF